MAHHVLHYNYHKTIKSTTSYVSTISMKTTQVNKLLLGCSSKFFTYRWFHC